MIRVQIDGIAVVAAEYIQEESISTRITCNTKEEALQLQTLLGAIHFRDAAVQSSLGSGTRMKMTWNTLYQLKQLLGAVSSYPRLVTIAQRNDYSGEHYVIQVHTDIATPIPESFKEKTVGSVADGKNLYQYALQLKQSAAE